MRVRCSCFRVSELATHLLQRRREPLIHGSLGIQRPLQLGLPDTGLDALLQIDFRTRETCQARQSEPSPRMLRIVSRPLSFFVARYLTATQ